MNRLVYILLAVAIYAALSFVPGINVITKPIGLLCTFLHEFGHAFFALISGGSVHSLCVNWDTSGVTTTSGGSPGLITMGGYVGSALFGNLMIRLSSDYSSSLTLKILAGIMIFSAFIWLSTFVTCAVLIVFSITLFIISNTKFSPFVLSFLGITSVVYIIQDFNVGPTSDLQAYESEVGLFPAAVWMYIWLGIVILITGYNLINIFKTKEK